MPSIMICLGVHVCTIDLGIFKRKYSYISVIANLATNCVMIRLDVFVARLRAI